MPPGGSCHRPPTETVTLTSSLFWSPDTGAYAVSGEIRDAYLRAGGPTGSLGYPLSDEIDTADGGGRVSHFEHGYIVWSLKDGAKAQQI